MIGKLTLDQLRVLVAVADTGSFTAASRAVGRAQSAISQMIAALENSQGVQLFDRTGYRPVLTEAGRVLVSQARTTLSNAKRFEAMAEHMRSGVEAELTLAIDPLVPSDPFMRGLRDLNERYPDLSISFSTEGLGGSLRRLRDRTAALGICILLPTVPDDVVAYPLMQVAMKPVVSVNHPLAQHKRSLQRSDLEPHIQLVLSDPVDPGGPNYGLTSTRIWRFSDLNRRLDFLLGGFGWCRMPDHLIAKALSEGRLVLLDIEDDNAPQQGPPIYAAHMRDKTIGPAARWFLDAMREFMMID
ncbi:LysR family transcriptional regulator [Parasulfitobacter algicola]|uniref:LysR family transcriptional regulator n=1 Tax=Parasulfitobacter algicola TaxID=2614809 RepID=A0ABX2IY86_9RHOB|nr:LysR family transcriptional regulator [Sulfitobacter algicola]NSX55178.1 LysR family transcriptional regulator [Sulfitobacter algicola]